MKLSEIAAELGLKVYGEDVWLDRDVRGGYTGDLLSDGMACGRAAQVWVTRQVHQNVVAVAVLKEMAGVIVVQDAEPGEDMLAKAAEECLPVMVSPLAAFELSARIYNLMQE